MGFIPAPLLAIIKDFSRWCLVTAIAALGMKTSLKAMADVARRAIALIVAETVFLASLVLVIVGWKLCRKRRCDRSTLREGAAHGLPIPTRNACR